MRLCAVFALALLAAGCFPHRAEAPTPRYARPAEPKPAERPYLVVEETPVVRVRLGAGANGRVELKADGGLELVLPDGKSGTMGGELVAVRLDNGRLAVEVGGRTWRRGAETLAVRSRGGHIRVGDRRYRGELRLFAGGTGELVVVNRLGIEEYLYGVVPCEIGPANEQTYEAIKAQAVAARTFTLARLGRRQGLGHDLFDSHLRDQEYRGAGPENEFARRAVDATRGEVLTYKGELVEALYHTTCGGVTNTGSQPYLKSVADSPGRGRPAWCANGSGFEWQAIVSADSLGRVLARLGSLAGRVSVRDWRLEKDKASGRVRKAHFTLGSGSVTVGGNELRMALGLKSHAFTIKRRGSGFQFDGFGWGHGSGMCQSGAVAMARAGHSAYEILNHYYSGVERARRY
ncbi:MAG: SpoIID/LytB domain-containing protein [bacterium]